MASLFSFGVVFYPAVLASFFFFWEREGEGDCGYVAATSEVRSFTSSVLSMLAFFFASFSCQQRQQRQKTKLIVLISFFFLNDTAK